MTYSDKHTFLCNTVPQLVFSLLSFVQHRCILATDMTRHNEILSKFKTILPVFDFKNKDHKDVVITVRD